MKKPNKSGLVQKAKQELLKRMLSSSSDRLSPNGTPANPVDFALWSIGRHAEAKATRMIISGKTKKLLPEIGQLDGHLRELEISHTDISDLSPLGELPSLERLKINATEVADWSALSSLKSLRRLELSFCGHMLVDVPNLPELTETKILNTHGKITLGSLPKLEKAEFQVLEDLAEVTKQSELAELSFQKIGNRTVDAFASLTNLRRLSGRLHGVVDLRPLASQNSLISLSLTAPEVSDIAPISELRRLETLELNSLKVSDARSISGLSKLCSLVLRFAAPLADLSFLSDMKELSRLVLCPAANSDLHPVTELPNLEEFVLAGISPHTDLSPLTDCGALRRLSVSTNDKVDGALSVPMPAPPRLETLSLYGRAIDSLSGLEKCRELQSLYCVRTTIGSLEPLKGMTHLKQVHVPGSNVSDLTVLATLPYFVTENPDIKLAIQDTPAVEQYPELAKTLGGGPLHQHEYGQHETAIKAVRAVTRGS
ncbi:hypothetical protein SLH49_08260 [Cognatiyoonia sp. IB215446]|uniref:hypothetical protein n=1 Tax=Cognatiyoonia sp. IB215446 TaxID=3097355 RepID=UPI002A0DAED7|nr:hypothetical protein [Cognatiyoonia sp. IB215446]MDX8347977.1 hypothetical protein [Cognatiyoonia sp. IB215446]